MQRHDGNGVFEAFSPLVGNPVYPAAAESGLFSRVRLVDRLVQRILVDVAVEGVGVDVAVVDVAGHRYPCVQTAASGHVEERRAVLCRVRLRVHARVVAVEKADLLKAVAVE